MGLPWSQAYYDFAQLYWDAEPSKDPGLHGFGASVYQRLLSNPKKLRLERQYYDGSVHGYCALMILIVSEIGKQMEKEQGYINRDEIGFIVDKAINVLEKYLSRHSNEKVKESLDFFYTIKRRASNSNNEGKTSKSSAEPKISGLRKGMNLVASVVFPITLAIIISNNKGLDWNIKHYIIAGILGVLIIFPLISKADKKNRKFRNTLNRKFNTNGKHSIEAMLKMWYKHVYCNWSYQY